MLNFPNGLKEANKDYTSLNELYGQVITQYGRYMGHVAKNIGGIMTTPKMVEQPGVVVEYVAKSKQKEAMAFLQDQLFKTPRWLIDNSIADYTGTNKLTTISNIQGQVLARLLGNSTFDKLLRFEAETSNAYTATEMVTDLRKGIWSELVSHQLIDIYRRNLQKAFVERLIGNLKPDADPNAAAAQARFPGAVSSDYSKTSDAVSIAKMQLRTLATEIRAGLPAYKDASSRAHLQDVIDRITAALDTSKN